MSIPDINQRLSGFLASNGISPETSSVSDLKIMSDLFDKIALFLNNSREDIDMIGRIQSFLGTIEPNTRHIADPIDSRIFEAKVKATFRKSQNLLEVTNLRRLGSREKIYKALGLDTWASTGNIELAKSKIMDCFLSNSTNLDLSELKLDSIPSLVFTYLPQLETLNISKNKLTHFLIPDTLSQLKELQAGTNQLSTLTLPSHMPRLEKLELSCNKLTTFTLISVPLLNDLDLSDNELVSLILPSSMPSLKYLTLYNNKLEALDLPTDIDNLLFLDLSINELRDFTLPYAHLLEGLNLSENRLRELHIPSLPNLEILQAFDNNMSTLELSDMPKLQELNISVNQLTRISLPLALPQMKRLHLFLNLLTSIPRARMPLLEHLDAANNQIEIRPTLSMYPNLVSVDITHNPFQYTIDETIDPLEPFQAKLLPDSPFQGFSISSLREDPLLFNQIHLWLDKLQTAKDFIEGTRETQSFFTERIFAILNLAIGNGPFRETLQAALSEALTSCVDRAAFSLNTIETVKAIFEVKDKPLTEAIFILKGAYALEKINEIATEFVISHRIRCDTNDMGRYDPLKVYQVDGISYIDGVDPIEVYLGLQVALKEDFELPIVTNRLNFFRCSQLSSENIIEAKEKVTSSLLDKNKVADFMTSNTMWAEKIKQTYSEEFKRMQEDFQHLLTARIGEPDYLSASEDSKKALLEPLNTAKNVAEKKWLIEKTLELLHRGIKRRL